MANLTSDHVLTRNAFTPHPGGTAGWRKATITVGTANLTVNDVIKIIPYTAGETIYDVRAQVADLDSNATPLLSLHIGDDVSANRYVATSTVGRTGGVVEASGFAPYTATANGSINVTVAAASATAQAGTITLWVQVA